MTNTSHLLMPLVIQSQAQKEITINEALVTIDALLNSAIKQRGLNSPPISPNNGDMYIIGDNPVGEWMEKAGYISIFLS